MIHPCQDNKASPRKGALNLYLNLNWRMNMNTIRKSTLAALFVAAAFAPLAVSAADFTSHDSAATPTPFSTGDRAPSVRAELGAPQFVTQESIATPAAGVAYDRVNGAWVRVDAGKDLSVPKPDLMGATFTQHHG